MGVHTDIKSLVQKAKDSAAEQGSEDEGADADATVEMDTTGAAPAGPMSKSQLDKFLRAQKMKRINKKKNSRNKAQAWW